SDRDWSSDVCSSDLAGLAPLRILSTKVAARRKLSATFGPYDIRPPSSVNSRSGKIVGSRCLLEKSIIGLRLFHNIASGRLIRPRSEERRVGKECRSW